MKVLAQRRINGFTLLELLLVLAILVAVTAIAVPTYEGVVEAKFIDNAAEQLRLDMQRMRVKAMNTGQAQMLQLTVGQGSYIAAPWMASTDETNAAASAVVQSQAGVAMQVGDSQTATQVATETGDQKSFETGVLVSQISQGNDSRTQFAQMQNGGASSAIATPILFYTDGTSSTSQIVLQDQSGRRRAIQLRGVSGRAKIVWLPDLGAS